jgi:hypothetical protein
LKSVVTSARLSLPYKSRRKEQQEEEERKEKEREQGE